MSRRSIFDTDRNGELDPIEIAAAASFLEEMESEENSHRTYQRKRTRKPSHPTGISFIGTPVYNSNKDVGCLRLLIALVLLALPFPLMFLFDVEPQSWGVLLCMLVPAAFTLLVLKNC